MRAGILVCQWALLMFVAAMGAQAAEFKHPTPYDAFMTEYARQHHLPTSLVRAMVKTESGYNRYAVSPKGAKGLMQLMPDVWQRYGVADPYNAKDNIRAGTAYFREMLDRFGSLTLALAAYNIGPETVERCECVPRVNETQLFVRSVINNYNKFRREIDPRAPLLRLKKDLSGVYLTKRHRKR
jgi:soluble lytic murein transglycosylase-like protein